METAPLDPPGRRSAPLRRAVPRGVAGLHRDHGTAGRRGRSRGPDPSEQRGPLAFAGRAAGRACRRRALVRQRRGAPPRAADGGGGRLRGFSREQLLCAHRRADRPGGWRPRPPQQLERLLFRPPARGGRRRSRGAALVGTPCVDLSRLHRAHGADLGRGGDRGGQDRPARLPARAARRALFRPPGRGQPLAVPRRVVHADLLAVERCGARHRDRAH